MAEKTQSVAQQAVALARKQVLLKDAAKVLTGIRKAARGIGCKARDKKKDKKGKKRGFPKASVLRAVTAKLLKQAQRRKTDPRGLAKVGAAAIIAIKRGNGMQKRATIGQLLQKLLPALKSGLGAAGRTAKSGLGAAGRTAAKGVGGASAAVKGLSTPMRAGLGGAAGGLGLGALLGGEKQPAA